MVKSGGLKRKEASGYGTSFFCHVKTDETFQFPCGQHTPRTMRTGIAAEFKLLFDWWERLERDDPAIQARKRN
jgi:hypothetical protein